MRIRDFKEYVEANRKDISSKQILATYSWKLIFKLERLHTS